MLKLRDLPIQHKLRLVIMGTCGAALLLAGTAFMIAEVVMFRQTKVRDMTALARVMGNNCAAALTFDRADEAEAKLATITSHERVLAVAVYDKPGKLFAKFPTKASEIPDQPGTIGEHFSPGRLTLFQPIVRDDEPIGTIYLLVDLQGLYERLGWFFAAIVLALGTAFVIALALSSQLQQLVARPILALTSTAKAISAQHDYTMRVEKMTNDELGVLTDAFNQMLTQVQAGHAALRIAHDELERRVEVRTAELKEANEQLQLLESRRRLIIETAHDAFIAIDDSDRIIEWNRQAENTFGWSRDEIQGRTLADTILPEQFREAHREGIKRYLATHTGEVLNKPIERTGRHRDGHEFPLEMTIWPVRVGNVCTFNAFARDITERQRTQEALARQADELARSNKELEMFAYVASHDLQEPLRAVAGFMELLRQRYGGKLDARADQYITHAVEGAKRMQSLIQGLLEYSRVSTYGKPFQPTKCEQLFTEVIANLQMAIRESRATVTHDPLPILMADEAQLSRLLQNLIANAIKFQDSHPPVIHVGAQRRPGHWEFTVRDNGIGIDPQYFDRIFVIYQRLHTQQEYPGAGLGLAICKRIVERHGGEIWVESSPGGGSTFHFTIPTKETNNHV